MKKHPLADIDADIREHIEHETLDNIARGMPRDEARAAALRAFGNVALVKEDVRAVWIPAWLEQIVQDSRFAMRTMRRTPGLTAIAVGSSALGIGACSVIFAILNVAVFKPLPVEDPGRLMSIAESDRRTGEAGNELSYPDFRDLREARSLDGVAASNPLLPAAIGLAGDPERHWGALVTANYFAVVKPAFAAGRGFDPARDDIRGTPRVVVLGYDLWQRGFGGDPGVLGRQVAINQRPATIVGITAAGFRGTDVPIVPEFWIPMSMIDELEARTGLNIESRGRHWLKAVARLRPGADMQAARAELDVIARRGNSSPGPGTENRGFHLERAGQIDPRLRVMALTFVSVALGVTALVLLTACVNVASLLLGRASARRREIAARLALGASRGRLLRQLLTESLVMASMGGIGGWVIAAYVSSLMGVLRTPLGWPLDLSVSLDYRVLLFCAGLSIATGVAFGLVPALRATRSDVATDLKADARGSATRDRSRLRNGLVVGQVAMCALLLVCTGLFLRSLQSARGLDLGLKNRNLLLMGFDPALDRRGDPEARRLLRDILEGAGAVPGVESATLTTAVPLTVIIDSSSFVPEERAADPEADRVQADIYAVGPDFFATMGIPFLAGDDFPLALATGKPVIVNEAFARAVFPNQSPIGRRVLGDGRALEIAGLVATAKSRTIGEAPRPAIYLPVLTEYAARSTVRGVTLVVRTTNQAASYALPLREAIRRVEPSLAVFDVRTMETHLREASLLPRLTWALSAVAGVVAAVLAMIGVYGVISSTVIMRRRELGIRLAIGARPQALLAMVLRQGVTLALIGTALGLLAALGVTRFAASLLYGVNPTDPATFAAVGSFLLAVAVVACALPARAAARVNPVEALRSE
jgi:predicted permease